MCGIAGIVRCDEHAVDNILQMNKAMHHRGPDAGDYYLDKEHGVIFGHRRLSIVDLSENGAQPMKSHSERFVICYNGEIYNYQKLQAKMAAEGVLSTLRGTSDTEVILEAFEHYGVKEALSYMKGMFALALYDRKEKKIYLTRDRVGEKPLYFGMVKGSFVFASDLACIKALKGFDAPIYKEVLGLYFQYGYIPAPYSIYEGIYKLEPGKILTLDVATLQYDIEAYWDMKEVALRGQKNLFTGSEEEASEELERLLKGAIKEQMIADVPLGAFLSGGIDSSLIVSLMQSQSERPVKTFTIGFEVAGYNEAEFAGEIAKHLGTEHTELYVGKKEAMEVLQHMPIAYTEPFADSSQIPTMLVSKLTRQHVTVSLSGDAGDELFCGYNSYGVARSEMEKLKNRFGKIPKAIRKLSGTVAGQFAGPNSDTLYKMANFFTIESEEKEHARKGLEDSKTLYLAKHEPKSGYQFGKHHILPCTNSTYQTGYLEGVENNLMLMDLLQYHPDDILVKVDRAGMFYSLETRIPLLDKDVVEYAWTLPLAYKYAEGVTKRAMRNVLYRYVPKEMMERPKKGFSVPMAEWLKQGEMHVWAEDILHDGKQYLSEYLNVKLIEQMWRDFNDKGIFTEKLWNVLMLEQWMLANRK